MNHPRHVGVITDPSQVTSQWLSDVLGETLAGLEVFSRESSWAKGAAIRAFLADGSERALWLKICLGETFGRSELDYYLKDYLAVPDPPLVRCFDGCFEEGIGYHLVLEDLSQDFCDRKLVQPTLEHGLALATALAKLHGAHWESAKPPEPSAWERYFNQVEPGVRPIEQAAGIPLEARFRSHAQELMQRWQDPIGMTLLHGDLNPTNVLTPKNGEEPVFFLDRQPFDWSLTYGLGAYDLAYAIVPWWPYELRLETEEHILRRWFEQLGQPGYTWTQAQADWQLSVEQCLHIPIEWCRKADRLERMRGLWQWQLGNILGIGF